MLVLVTGTPGAGKTLNTIKYISEQPQFKNRDIYYFGIRDLSPEFGWNEMTEEQAYGWHDLPSGSVIVFDEAYNIFPAKHGGKDTPDHVKKLAVHRHKGFDIFLVCQKVVGQLDTFVRGLVNEHHHYQRIFGSKTVNRFVWTSCQNDPNSSGVRKNANITPCRLDKKYYGKYHSADQHTHTLQLPTGKIALAVICLILLFILLFIFKRQMMAFAQPEKPQPQQSSFLQGDKQQNQPNTYSQNHDPELKRLSLAESLIPTVKGLPWTAPIYNDQLKAKTWPRPAACMILEKLESKPCKCFTQQATPLEVDYKVCIDIARNGFFDFTKSDNPQPKRGRVAGSGGDLSPPADPENLSPTDKPMNL